MVQKRRTLAESLLRSPRGTKAAKRYKKLIKLQGEIDVIDDAIADEQLLSPSLALVVQGRLPALQLT
jgi:hypothetical protein